MDRLMKINIWTLACLLMGLTACTDSSDELVQKGNEITLKLINHEMSRSEGVEDLNENLIKNADIFFFAYDAETKGPIGNCLYHHPVNDLGDDGVQTEHEFSISANNFTDNTSYYIYAIANLEIANGYKGTIGDLKALTATPISVTTGENVNNGIQDHFVMDGFNDTFTYTKGMTGTTTIPLTRSAAKITLTVNVASSVTVGGATFTPQTSAMKVRMINGEKNGVVNGEATTSGTLTTDYYSIDQATKTHSVPFYSYPTNTIGENACYLELMIPWDSSNGTVNNNYYYIIPIETDVNSKPITKLERNHHYIVDVNVSILGSLREEPVTLNPKFLVKDWNTVALDADLKNYRYLWVQEPANGTYWVMNNTEILEIPYTTSHDCKIVSITCQQKDLSMPNPIFKNASYDDLNLTQKDGYIYFENELNNNFLSNSFDFSPYHITFTIQHIDNTNYTEDITIIQYPAIYGEAFQNSDYSNGGDENGDNGFVFVNGYTGKNNGNKDYFCSANGMAKAYSGASPNMYTFTVTSVEGTPYIIGDPREKDNYTYTAGDANWANANALYGGPSRELNYYYGTEASSRTEMLIAPRFRIASAYAVLDTGDDEAEKLENLKKRCASYQEDGYPAGRWRLPTKSEFEFIFSLVNREKLPAIYQLGSEYWCAHGLGEPQSDGTVDVENILIDNGGHSVRCVYDEWYWGSDPALTEKSTFTWGDEPITR